MRLLITRWAPSLLLLLALPVQAEYRVYELEIKDSTNGSARATRTTLDDIQYRSYNALKSTESVSIKDTWMCYPRSDYFKNLCAKPAPKAALPPQPKPAES